jgi:hypothetical protein
MRRTSSEGSKSCGTAELDGDSRRAFVDMRRANGSSCELPKDDAAQPEEQQAATRVNASIALPRICGERRACVPRHTASFSVCHRRHVSAKQSAPNRASIPAKGSSAKAAAGVHVPQRTCRSTLCDHVPVLQSASRCCRRATSWLWRSTPIRIFLRSSRQGTPNRERAHRHDHLRESEPTRQSVMGGVEVQTLPRKLDSLAAC